MLGFVTAGDERVSARPEFASVVSPPVLVVTAGVDEPVVVDGGDADEVAPVVGDEPDDDVELVDAESVPDGVDGSAVATPGPYTTAAPIPNATASPPICPTVSAAPMGIWLPWVPCRGKLSLQIRSVGHAAYGQPSDHTSCSRSIRNLHPRR